MSFQDKLKAAEKELSRTEIWKSNYNPPTFVLLRKLGLNMRPYHYNTFIFNFLTSTIWFGFFWGILMWLSTWKSQNMPIQDTLISSIISGLIYGVLMAFYYKLSAKKNNLTNWQQL